MASKQGAGLSRLRRHSDLVLALAVAAIVGMMILPLPTAALDLLLTLNLAVSVTLLLVAIYVSDALRIATFPSLLLLTTLFRLGLNVSSTRLILLQADAGRVIDAFGHFVVQGNYVVGAVVFAILLIIQFVVIAKGSERVAEVAARFTLDALPGKQLAIDADQRAGLLDQAEARARRRALGRESQFYGAMDGAMKFVKGDAIAGVVITLVNIAAGLTIGVLQRGLDAGQALRVYGLLTIGDGLVSQIPALVISTAAGLVVTRVASEEEGAHLGEEITGQVLAHPRALAITAGLLALLAAVPGLPTVPFLLLAALCAAAALGLVRARRGVAERRAAGDAAETLAEAAAGQPSPVALEVGRGLTPLVAGDRDSGGPLEAAIAEVRRRIGRDLGVLIPPVEVRLQAASIDDDGYTLLLDELPEATATLPPGRWLCLAAPEAMTEAGLTAQAAEHPLGEGGPLSWVPEAEADRARAAGFQVLDHREVITAHLEQLLRRRAGHFVGVQAVAAKIDELERTDPALVRAVLPKVVDLPKMAEVFRRLIDEGLSLRNTRAIVEAILERGEKEKDPVALTELVRQSLRRQITRQYCGGEPELPVYLLSPDLEEAVRGAIQRSSTGTYLALDPDLGREIVETLGERVTRPAAGRDAVILTQPDVRRFLRKLIELRLPHAAVLSYQELEPTITVRTLTRIGIPGLHP